MTCNGSGWISIGVGNATHEVRCAGCPNCKPTEYTDELTVGLQCQTCLKWYPNGEYHVCLVALGLVPSPVLPDISGLSV